MIKTHPQPSSLDRDALLRCIEDCIDCAATCTSCADACLGEKDLQELVRCIRLCLDCADACEAAGRIVTRQTALDLGVVRAAIEACAAACRACGEECEHDAAAALPALSLRRPLHSAQALLTDRSWLLGFALESGGFALYVAALALAPLTLVQSVSAGGIGILAFVSARMRRRRLGRHELAGALISMFGLLALAVSLAGGSGEGTGGSTFEIVLWLAATAGA